MRPRSLAFVAAAFLSACATGVSSPPAGSGPGNGGPVSSGPVAIVPENPTLILDLPTGEQGVQFACVDGTTGAPLPSAEWSVASPALGAVTSTGFFAPNGKRVGAESVTCTSSAGSATTVVKVVIHTVEDPDAIPAAQKDVLRGPAEPVDEGFRFLYPYEGTVFPKGILSPELQLAAGEAPGDIHYVHAFAPDVDYEGFFLAKGDPPRFTIPQDTWEALENAAAGAEVEVQVAKIAAGKHFGPLQRSFRVAPGGLHGTIYYNTYDSPLAGGNGAIMRIKGNAPSPEVLVGGCTVCHSISADGSTAAANLGVFDLLSGAEMPPLVWDVADKAAYAALYPLGGEVLVTQGETFSGAPSELRTRTGSLVPASGVESFFAEAPVFSVDGTRLAFTNRNPVPPSDSVLATLAYDAEARKFSDYEVLAVPPVGHTYAWPAFTPDRRFVVFQDSTGPTTFASPGNTGRLLAFDLQSGKTADLRRLNGEGLVPRGARDLAKNYEPTIAPIASGGYFWVMFTSRRTYGNRLTDEEFHTKRLWVAALDIAPAPGADFSHPAFYLAGQEMESGNSRGFWTLDPCKGDGVSCASGDECCAGHCNPGPEGAYLCGPPGACSEEFESCTDDAQCCDALDQCLGGKCTYVPPK